MTLLIDTASAARRLNPGEFENWTRDRKVFVSSVMDEFASERKALATSLRQLGVSPILFEEFGGRDEDAERAFFTGVDQSDIYLGIIGDRYGTMQQPEGRSATHAEYRHARSQGKRISVWSREPSLERQGDERDFLAETQLFHTTGRFETADELVAGVSHRLEEIAADDESPWIKLGECVFRVDRIRVAGNQLTVSATVRDSRVSRHLQGLGANQWGQTQEVPITSSTDSGQAKVNNVAIENTSTSVTLFEIEAQVVWGSDNGSPMMAGTGSYSAEDLVKVGIESGLLVTNLPDPLQGNFVGNMIDASDPLRELLTIRVPEGTIVQVARLLLVERLVGGGFASHLDSFEMGPESRGVRNVHLEYTDVQRYSNTAPVRRTVKGKRPW